MAGHDFETLRDRLRAPETLLTDLDADTEYAHDATTFAAHPSAVLVAESVEDIISAVEYCHEHRLCVTPRGAGTGLSGGCIVSPGGLLLSTEKLNELEIRADLSTAICGPGVITKDLVDAASQHNLTYPPDPASFEESSLGGNVAENAGGLRCLKYGVTKDYVLGLEAVLPDGSLLRTGWFNDNAGFNLGDLLIGAEGTLAIITRIALRLIDRPGRGITMLVGFEQPEDSARTVTEINRAGIVPTVMEFLDGDAAACSNQYERAEDFGDLAGILLFETSDTDAEGQAARIERICRENRCTFMKTEPDPDRAERLWRVRRNLSNAVKAAAVLRISEDVAVPNSRFSELVGFVAEMNRTSRLRINSFGHAGDGNLHVNFMDSSASAEDRAEAEREVARLMRKTLELGGTLTGEHGIGLAKRRFVENEFDGPTLRLMRTIKKVFDPYSRLNPDKIWPEQTK